MMGREGELDEKGGEEARSIAGGFRVKTFEYATRVR